MATTIDARSATLRRAWLLDGAVTVAMMVFALAIVQANLDLGPRLPWVSYAGWPLNIVVLVASIAPVAVRRRWPLTALVVSVTGLIVARFVDTPDGQVTSIALFLCIYAAGRWGEAPNRDWIRSAATVGLLAMLIVMVGRERQFLTDDLMPARAYYLLSMVGIVSNLVYLIASWLFGDSARRGAERTQELADKTEELAARTKELERQREENARQAVVEERLRIARELHDVVAHHVSVMGVQAAATRRLIDVEPARVGPGLEAIEQASRDAVIELHRLLGFLRRDEESMLSDEPDASVTPEVPIPGLSRIDVMRRHLADAGLALSLRTTGEPRPLPPTVDVSAFRILQESLTNVLKHGHTDQAEVRIDYGTEALRLQITDDGPGPARRTLDPGPGAGVGAGKGIAGMTERAALVGGTLRAEPRAGGGFVVVAELPYDRLPTSASVDDGGLTSVVGR